MKVNPIESARKKLRQDFPYSFAQCTSEAALYGKCIAQKLAGDLKMNDCLSQFNTLKDCFQKAMKKAK
jgi:hypothetical protein